MADEKPKPKGDHSPLHDKSIDDLLKEYQGFHNDKVTVENAGKENDVWTSMYNTLNKHLGDEKLRGYNNLSDMDKWKKTETLLKKIMAPAIEAHHGADAAHYLKNDERFQEYINLWFGRGQPGTYSELIKTLANEEDLITAFRKNEQIAGMFENYLHSTSALERNKSRYKKELLDFREHEHDTIISKGDELLKSHGLKHKPGVDIEYAIGTHAQYGTGLFRPKKNRAYQALPPPPAPKK